MRRMRRFRTNVKSALFYSARDIMRRPRETLTLAAIMTAVMMALVLLILWIEAEWRADVMPERESNYHFEFLGLTEEQKSWIREQEWVQTTHDIPESEYFEYSRFLVRIGWNYLDRRGEYVYDIIDRFDLLETDAYRRVYNTYYNSAYGNISSSPFITAQYIKKRGGVAAMARDSARLFVVRNNIENLNFIVKTTQNYLIMPENLMTMMFFSLFLGGAVFIVMNERYRRGFSEIGSLRALGFTKTQIYYYAVVRGALLNLLSVIPTSVFVIVSMRIFRAVTRGIGDDGIYMTLADSIPAENLLASFLCLFLVTAAANVIVCAIYSKQTVMDGLRGRETLEVSFVEVSSWRFERRGGAGAYTWLYIGRTKKRMIVSSVAVMIMIPLPILYLFMALSAVRESSAAGAYFIFQAAMLLVSAVTVIAMSSFYTVRGRMAELSILRSMGMRVCDIAKMISASALVESAISSFMAGILFAAVYTSASAVTEMTAVDMVIGVLTGAVIFVPLAALFIVLPSVIGAVSGMAMIMRSSITACIRSAD